MFKSIDHDFNFIDMEHKWLKHWYEKGIDKKYRQKNSKSKKYFSFLDGPITANNPMGVHHAWGRTYKDLWPRFYNLLGYKQRFQNGFDCQGLWVEVEVEKELGLRSKKDIENLVPGDTKKSIAKFVQLCKDRVNKFAGIQTEQSKRLAYFADWDNSYFTMSDNNNYMIWLFLKKCFDNGWIYKGNESVPWCPRCETAISQHEMLTEDYKELVHKSVIIEFKVQNSKFKIQNKNSTIKEFLLVWTTTPWTIPANIAVAVDPEADYSLVQGGIIKDSYFWVMKDLIKPVFSQGHGEIIKTVKGKELVGLKYSSPFDSIAKIKKVAEKHPDKFHRVIATDNQIMPISKTEGTGLVHTAVSAGTEDFQLGKKLGLPMIPVIEDNANYLSDMDFLSGKNAKKHPEVILDYMIDQDKKGNDCVFSIFNYKHRYPACWRCKTELVWKVEDEWYIAMDKSSKILNTKSEIRNKSQISNFKLKTANYEQQTTTLRQRMIEVAKKIKWMPEFGLDRELDWLKNMHDWLISKKNRYWGLALPIYECKKCGHFEVIESKKELKTRAVSGWDQFEGNTPHKPYIDEVVIKCSQCGAKVNRINDVGNPWLDAGIVAYSTIAEDNQGEPLYNLDKKEWKKWFPANFITESFPGQFKNWFYALIAMSTVMENEPPFKNVLGFGTLLGEDGRAMHKSWGNSIEFNEGADKIGVDVVRWMFCRQNPADNMLFGYKKADEVRRQFYLMLWNIYKFFIEYANLDKYQITNNKSQKNNQLQISNLKNVLDNWIVSRFASTVLLVEKNLKDYNAKDGAIEIEKFVNDLSTWYIRRSRDRVWVNTDDKNDREEFYQTLYYLLVNLSIIISPFMPFISEEMYTNLVDGQSVHLSSWPDIDKKLVNKKLEDQMIYLRDLITIGHAKRKETGTKVRIPLLNLAIDYPDKSYTDFSDDLWKLALDELNVKNLTINQSFSIPKKPVVLSKLELQYEGELRDLIRTVQSKRKEQNLKPTDLITVVVLEKFKKSKDLIIRKTMAKDIKYGQEISIER